ncbi:MMPL family transporter [Marinimicrobium sp. ARAG 43.8]|uniref:MMPL family transporter n=1 Tax=Marinimicrobium sp. ARAG 43.8 TaxID=3418719 RepID=UPI003CF60E7E
MMRRQNHLALVLLVVIAALVASHLPRLTFDNDLLALFPASGEYDGQARADEWRAESVTGKVLLLLGSERMSITREAARSVAHTLSRCDCFTRVITRIDTDTHTELSRHYQQYLPNLLTPAHRESMVDGAASMVQDGLQRLMTHPGPGAARTLQQDPLGTVDAYLQWLRGPAPEGRLDESGLLAVTLEGQSYLLLEAELSGSPYSLSMQNAAGRALDDALTPFMGQPGARVLKTGTLFYAMAGSAQARSEMSTVGLGSVLGICCILLLIFRSPGLLALGFVPIAMGVAAGAVATHWLFGSIHVMALVFGGSLVGVAVDYSMHCFARRQFAGNGWRVWQDMEKLFVPLTLGLITSSLAYLSLILAGFPGFRQIAVFSAAGLVTAYLAVVAVFPYALAKPPRSPLLPSVARGVSRWRRYHKGIGTVPAWAWVVTGAVSLMVLVATVSVNDDIRQMQKPDAVLKQQEQQFRQAFGADTSLPYILVSAGNRPALLERLEALAPVLDQAVADGQLSTYRSVAHFIPSPSRQMEHRRLWQARVESGDLQPLLELLLPPVQDAVSKRLTSGEPLPWTETWSRVKALPDPPVYFEQDDRYYAAVTLQGLASGHDLDRRLASVPHADWVDPVARTNHLLKSYRVTAGELLLLAYAVVSLCLMLRYGWRGALACVSPPALASLLSLATQSALGQSISVFHLMALLLVLGIGIDYTLFMRESGDGPKDTFLAIGLSTLTTMLSFGFLSLSGTVAIASFGLTVLIGIALSFLLAPIALPRDDPLPD